MNHKSNLFYHKLRKIAYSSLSDSVIMQYVEYAGGESYAGFGTVDRTETINRYFTMAIRSELNERELRELADSGITNRNSAKFMISDFYPLYNKENVVLLQPYDLLLISTGVVSGSDITVSDGGMTPGLYKNLYIFQDTDYYKIIDNTATVITVEGSPVTGSIQVSNMVIWYPIFKNPLNVSGKIAGQSPFYEILCTNVPITGK